MRVRRQKAVGALRVGGGVEGVEPAGKTEQTPDRWTWVPGAQRDGRSGTQRCGRPRGHGGVRAAATGGAGRVLGSVPTCVLGASAGGRPRVRRLAREETWQEQPRVTAPQAPRGAGERARARQQVV